MEKPHLGLEQSHQLRGIAILMILFVHSINEYPAYETSWSQWLLIPQWGELGCSIFFLLSGYGLTIAMQREREQKERTRYWLTKMGKILKPYLLTYAVTFVALTLFDGKYGADYQFDVRTIFTLSMSDGNEMWFMKVILANYVFLFILDAANVKPVPRVIVFVSLHLAAALLLRTMGLGGYWYVSNLCFPVGMALALPSISPSRRQVLWAACSLVVGGAACYGVLHWRTAGEIMLNTGVAVGAFLLASYRGKTCPALRFPGKNSLLLYLFEIPVMWVIPSEGIHWSLYFAACLICTVLCAVIYVSLCSYRE